MHKVILTLCLTLIIIALTSKTPVSKTNNFYYCTIIVGQILFDC